MTKPEPHALRRRTCQNLAEMRRRLHLTQAELATRVGVLQSHVAHWEGGRRNPTLTNLCRLADALQCSVDDLIGRTNMLHNRLTLLPVQTLLREVLRRVGEGVTA